MSLSEYRQRAKDRLNGQWGDQRGVDCNCWIVNRSDQ